MATIDIGKLTFTHKGDYDASTAYVLNDVVYYQGSAYIAKQNTTGNVPTNATYWNQFSAGSGGIWNSGLSMGSAGQAVLVNAAGNALEFGSGGKGVKVNQFTNNTSTSSYNNITSRTPFWSFTWNKQYADSLLEVSVHMPFVDQHQYHPHFSVMGIRFSTTNYDTNGSDIYGYFHHVDQDQSSQSSLASAYTGQMVYDTASTNISAAGTVYVRMVLNSSSGSAHGGLGEWNYNGDNRQMVTPISTVIIKEYEQ